MLTHRNGRRKGYFLKKHNGYWDKERCLAEAKKYLHRNDFRKLSGGAYSACRREKWLEEACKHMRTLCSLKNRFVYVFVFNDNSAYIGITYNLQKRKSQHTKDVNSPVFKKISQGYTYKFIASNKSYVAEIIAEKEADKITEFRKKGFQILNKNKAGGLGGNIRKWTKLKSISEARKYKSKKEFYQKSSSAYNACKTNGWIKEACSHMENKRKPSNYWTFNRCLEEAKKYGSRREFYLKNQSAYNMTLRNGWSKEIYEKIGLNRKYAIKA